MKKLYNIFIAITFLSMAISANAATGEVTKSGSTWTTKVDGSTKYTGSDMLDAINAACSYVGSGTIHVRSSGTAYAPNGLRWVNLRSNQTIDFHGNTMNCQNALQVYPIKAYKRSNLTVKNLNVTGVPRYVLHFDHCNDITLTNITSNTSNGNGLRIQDGNNLTINGNINLKTVGHSIETMRFNDIYIGKVTVESSKGCGVLFNTSENCNIDEIWAYNCCPDGSYAGFRQANSNGTTHCKFLRAKNCGRGLYVITSSHNTTIDKVDIDDCNQSGISITGTAYKVRVNSGTISNTPKAIDLWNGYSDVCIKVNGSSYGDACSGSGGSYYGFTNRNSSKCIAVAGSSSSDGANIEQYSCNSSAWSQQYSLQDVGSGYYLIKNRNSGKCLSVVNGSKSDGANIEQRSCNSSYWRQQFSFVNLNNGYYQIKNRNSGKCLSVYGGSSSNGANIEQRTSNTSYWRQQFSMASLRSASLNEEQPTGSEEIIKKEIAVYPSVVTNTLNITLENNEATAQIDIYNNLGKVVVSEKLVSGQSRMDLSHLSSGMYIVKISSEQTIISKKIIKK